MQMVWDFVDVFHTDLSGVPPDSDIDFAIDFDWEKIPLYSSLSYGSSSV